MHKNIDRCKETTSTTGTGTLTLTGAVSGFVGVANATNGLTVDGDTGWFCAENGAEWEVFLGTRVSSTTLARTTVLSSSNAGAAVSFTAAPTVFSTVPASAMAPLAGPAFSAYRGTSNQSVTSATLTKVQFNAEEFDTDSLFDSTTNYRFTPNIPGYYSFSWCVRCDAPATTITDAAAILYKNGSAIKTPEYVGSVAASIAVGANALVYMNGTTDYVEVYTYITGTTPRVGFGLNRSFFSGHLARA